MRILFFRSIFNTSVFLLYVLSLHVYVKTSIFQFNYEDWLAKGRNFRSFQVRNFTTIIAE